MKYTSALLCLVFAACVQDGKATLTYPDGMRWAEWTTEEWGDGTKRAAGLINQAGNKEGLWTFWHDNGQKKEEGEYKDGKREGLWTQLRKNGEKIEAEFKDGELEGLWTWWHDNGQKAVEGECKEGNKVGNWIYWDENGKKIAEKMHPEQIVAVPIYGSLADYYKEQIKLLEEENQKLIEDVEFKNGKRID